MLLRYKKFLTFFCYFLYNYRFYFYIKELLSVEKKSNCLFVKYKVYKILLLNKYLFKNEFYSSFYGDLCNTFSTVDFLPIIDKLFITKNINFFSDSTFSFCYRSTSGTSGFPFYFFKDKNSICYNDAMMHVAYGWHGIEIGDRQARIWGRALSTFSKTIQIAKDLLLNRKRLSAFEMDDKHCLHFYEQLLRFQPKYFYAYPNALYQFALFIERNHLDGNLIGVDVAICTGEVLFPHHRSKISEVFGCRVVNEYGSTENGIIGFECEYGHMHIMPTVHIEIENPDDKGFGNILVTELNSRSIPFVRYRIGDIGRLINSGCQCNRPYELLEIRNGRIDDYVRCPDGRLVYDAVFAYAFKDIAIQFKVIQDSVNHLEIFLIPVKIFNVKTEGKLRQLFLKYFGESMNIDFFIVDSIPVESTGKYRYFKSNL